jgi:hypothetical protein
MSHSEDHAEDLVDREPPFAVLVREPDGTLWASQEFATFDEAHDEQLSALVEYADRGEYPHISIVDVWGREVIESRIRRPMRS